MELDDGLLVPKTEYETEESNKSDDEKSESEDEEVKFQKNSVPRQIELYPNQKGGTNLFCDGFTYVKTFESRGRRIWRCTLYREKCKARVTSTGLIESVKTSVKHGSHYHDPEPFSVGVAHAMHALKTSAALELHAKPVQLIADITSRFPSQVPYLASRSSLKKTIHRVKREFKNALPQEPVSSNFDLDPAFMILNNERLMIMDWKEYDNETKKWQRVFIITTRELFNHFLQSTYVQTDATFDIASKKHFKQFFTAHGNIQGDSYTVYPMVFAFMTDKSQKLYEKFWMMLGEEAEKHHKEFHFKFHESDFEVTAWKAVEKIFPDVKNHGCFFHLCQSIIRQVKKLQLHDEYTAYEKDGNPVYLFVKILMALAYLPAEEIPSYFNALLDRMIDECEEFPKMLDLYEHFYETYVGSETSESIYPCTFWLVFDSMQRKSQKTNGAAETFHHSFHEVVAKQNPGFYFVVQELKKRIVEVQAEIQKHLDGHPTTKLKKYVKLEDTIRKIVATRSERKDPAGVLESIARNIDVNTRHSTVRVKAVEPLASTSLQPSSKSKKRKTVLSFARKLQNKQSPIKIKNKQKKPSPMYDDEAADDALKQQTKKQKIEFVEVFNSSSTFKFEEQAEN